MHPRTRGSALALTPETPLSRAFLERTRAALDAVSGHVYFGAFAEGTLSRAAVERGLLGFYPLVEGFPRTMARILARLDPRERPRAEEARGWLLRNIATEERHHEWWVDLGAPFGIGAARFAAARPSARMDAQNHYLFRIAETGTIAEAVAAVNWAVEGATGVWTRALAPLAATTARRFGLEADERALRWLTAHADYDDRHPVEALEVVKIYATDEAEMARAAAAAERSLEYYAIALDDALGA
jgi:pyrroloquinoline quinone (PQQ) biosynthesis protein C